MRTVVVTDPPRADVDDAATLGNHGVATVHEALGRTGYLGPEFRPAWPGARIGGTAVTALCWPGDNLMIHVAVEQCRPGDVLVVATSSPSTDGLFGELFATALARRGVRGVVLASGVRDVAELRAMGFPAWSRAVSAQGSVKATPGAGQRPRRAGRADRPPRRRRGRRRRRRHGACRAGTSTGRSPPPGPARPRRPPPAPRSQAGELGLDRYDLRGRLEELGVEYVPYEKWTP